VSCKDCSSCAARTNCEPVSWRLDPSKILRLCAFISIICAYFIGQYINQPDWELELAELYPGAEIHASQTLDNVWEVTKGDETFLVGLGTDQSYGGPLTLATSVDMDGTVTSIDILNHSDTPAYIQKLKNNFYFLQFENKPVDHPFVAGEDYDAISGATLSSNAIMHANASAAHYLAREQFGKQPPRLKEEILLHRDHALIALLLAMVLLNIKLGNPHLKLAITLTSLVVMGFFANQMINVANFSSLILGFVPSLAKNPGFWILIGSVFAGIILLGRNIYCGNICPFHAVQYLLGKIGGLNLPLYPWVRRYGRYIPAAGLWAGLMIGLLTHNPTAGAYEPFGMIFSLQGEGIQWYIMPAVTIGCLFVPDMFCRFFCPAGEALNRLTRLRNMLVFDIKEGK